MVVSMSDIKLVKQQSAPDKMVKQEPVDVELEGQPYYRMNRKARRKLAKSFKLFKGKDRSAWRAANAHMESEANKTVVIGEDLKNDKKRNN